LNSAFSISKAAIGLPEQSSASGKVYMPRPGILGITDSRGNLSLIDVVFFISKGQ